MNQPGVALIASAPPDLPPYLADHLPKAEAAALENQRLFNEADGKRSNEIWRQLVATMGPSFPAKNRGIRIRHLTGELSAHVSKKTACASGCSHCCNLTVAVPLSEAKIIAKATGLKMAEPANIYRIDSAVATDYFGKPCTLLVDGKCSIYDHRPFVCRAQVNMDSTDLLCRLVPGVKVPVPYLNNNLAKAMFVQVTAEEDYADVREWFPSG